MGWNLEGPCIECSLGRPLDLNNFIIGKFMGKLKLFEERYALLDKSFHTQLC